MESNKNALEFLDAVEELRSDDEEVRTTMHGSSVSTDGWKTQSKSNA